MQNGIWHLALALKVQEALASVALGDMGAGAERGVQSAECCFCRAVAREPRAKSYHNNRSDHDE